LKLIVMLTVVLDSKVVAENSTSFEYFCLGSERNIARIDSFFYTLS